MAAVDYFLKLDGIEGEAQSKGHEKEIDLESWGWGATQGGTFAVGGGGGAGKVAVKDFHFATKICTACPKLALACFCGTHIKKAVLTCRKAGKTPQEFYQVTMEDVLVSSYDESGSGHSDIIPLVQFSLNFARVTWSYKPQNSDGMLGGAIVTGYDLKKMVKV